MNGDSERTGAARQNLWEKDCKGRRKGWMGFLTKEKGELKM